jgi:citrate lyase subunit beta/citryl-CoA lyase
MIEKALELNPDGIIFDLEDAVTYQEKDQARLNVCGAIARARSIGKEILVRVNAVESYLGIKDILDVVPAKPDTLILPKADDRSIITADLMIGALEKRAGWEANTIGLIPLIETAYSILNAYKVLGAANRVNGVQLGAEDLSKELEIARTRGGDELQYARSTLVFAARARGIDIIDTPFPDFRDNEGLLAEVQKVKALGMTGKACIHPNQLATVNSVFTPGPDEIEYARRVVEAFARAVEEGKGACSLDGKMIDIPIAEKAQKVIRRAEAIGAL